MTTLHIYVNGNETPVIIPSTDYEQADDFDPDVPEYILNPRGAEAVLYDWEADNASGDRGWESLEDSGGTYILASAFGGEISFFHWYASDDDETYSTIDFGWDLDANESEDDE